MMLQAGGGKRDRVCGRAWRGRRGGGGGGPALGGTQCEGGGIHKLKGRTRGGASGRG